ncbi:MAG: zinc-ribbon domain-containing protein [Acidobacteriota bacterium]|nr:zinc-ribbon domain-containing protein [Acidobacteriota bacterium]
MALVICPECGNEVSDQAVACPKCGRPFEMPTVVVPPPVAPREPVIVTEPPRNKSFPNWIFIPIIIVLAVVALFLFMMMQESEENDNRAQVNVRLRESETASRTRAVSNAEAQTGTSQTVTTAPQTIESAPVTQIPDSTVSSVPQTAYPTTGTTSNTAVTSAQPSAGNLEIKATVASRTGTPQPVKQERFYLLNKSLDEILSRANIDPEEGDLASTCAAAVIDPARRETRQKCLAAINPHIVYRVTTDSTGKGTFKDVKPDSYYVFGVTKVGTDSYALWNTTVTVTPGENLLNLSGSGAPLSPVGLNNSSSY